MTPRDQIALAAGALRRAVEGQRYTETGRLLADYCQRVEAVLRAEPGAPANERMADQARDLFEWTRRSVLCAAAQDAARLAQLPPKNAYNTPSSPAHMLRVDG